MTKRMLLAGLLALTAVPVLAADVTADRKVATPVSTDEARALAGKQIAAQAKADQVRACSCAHGS